MKLASMMVAVACALGAFSGCSVSIEPIGVSGPPTIDLTEGHGELTLNWLVAGTTSASVCAQYGADRLELVVYDERGTPVAKAIEPCESFTVNLALPQGTYSADATLLTAGGRSLSTTSTMHALRVTEDTNLAVNLDFPPDSMR